MKNLMRVAMLSLICTSQMVLAQTKKTVESFSKVTISPHIETTFVQGDEESVTILKSTEPEDKINIEVKGENLRVYLEGAKETTKTKKTNKNGARMNIPIYKGKVLSILITYKYIEELSIRGEQQMLCESLIDVEKFKLSIYGDSEVTFNEVNIQELEVNSYGENKLTIHKGSIYEQKLTAYGESYFDLIEVYNTTSKLTAYGEAKFLINASERIKFTAYGEAELSYKGTADIVTGIRIGDSKVQRID